MVFAIEFAILGHVLFSKNRLGISMELLQFQEQIKQGHKFVPALLANTIKCYESGRQISIHLECYVSLLQVWFLKHLVACKPFVAKGLLQEFDPGPPQKNVKEFLQKLRRLGLIIGELKTRSVMLEAQLASYRRSNILQ